MLVENDDGVVTGEYIVYIIISFCFVDYCADGWSSPSFQRGAACQEQLSDSCVVHDRRKSTRRNGVYYDCPTQADAKAGGCVGFVEAEVKN
jgi:hypothetical protein